MNKSICNISIIHYPALNTERNTPKKNSVPNFIEEI